MLILGRDQLKDPSLGYARTFVRQVEDCLGLALERGVKIVSNAGGLNPAGLAARLGEVAAGLGLSPAIAYVDGDDVRSLGLREGADRQRLPRRVRHRRRSRRRRRRRRHRPGHRRLPGRRAGGLVARLGRRRRTTRWPAPSSPGTCWSAAARRRAATSPGSAWSTAIPAPLGFPLAEVAADGSSVITKHDGTGGLVTVDTVTAQLMYEMQGPAYLGPDVTTDLDSVRLARRRARPGARLRRARVGSARAAQGLRQRAGRLPQLRRVRADRARRRGQGRLGAGAAGAALTASSVTWTLGPLPRGGRRHRGGRLDAAALHGAGPVARSGGPRVLGRRRRARAGVVPRLHDDRTPGAGTPFGVYRAEYVDRSAVTHTVHHADGTYALVEEVARSPVTRPGDGRPRDQSRGSS